MRPDEIERESMRIIQSEIGEYHGLAENLPVIKRVIHATADFDFLDNLYFSDNVVKKAREALKNLVPVVTDTLMLAAGISKKYNLKIICNVADEDIKIEAQNRGVTRSVINIERAVKNFPEAIYAIGNAPTALMRLCELIKENKANPAFIIGVPVGFDTDVNGSALGEHTFGIGRNVDSLVYITIGTGIGIGVINEGKLLHGGMHPEGGHIMLTKSAKDPFECICPYHKSCFEGLASGPAIEKRWGRKGQELAGNDEVWALEADYIAKAIFNYTAVLSPKMIILGGGVMHQKQLFPLIREAFKKRNNGYIKNRYTEDTDSYIVCQSLDDKQGILGAYVLGRQSLGMA